MRMLMRVAGLALAVLVAGCGPQKIAEPQKMVVRYALAMPVEAGGPSTRPAYIAIIRGDEETDLSFKVGGIVERIGRGGDGADWQEGAEVEKGEVLAQLKQSEFQNALNSARAKAELSRKLFDRAGRLLKEGAVSQQEFDTIQADKISSEASLAQREQDVRDSTLLAPYKGTVLARLAKSGETISTGKTVLRFASLDQMSVELGVPDRMVGQIPVGKEIPLEISALEGKQLKQFLGRVSEVGVAAKEGGRLFKVVIKVENRDRLVKSGMMAKVFLEESGAVATGAVLVPLSALVARTGGELAVFVVGEDGEAHERPIKTDDIVRSSIIVTEGLQPKEKVVVVGASSLYEGAPLDARPVEKL
ncbi:MAG: efflux RND transporter periplasmic adaptor subunit [Chloroflexi bacterium]|nr:efflux RND transporter periplasmic adaptor subunit [Chloroflexota bacterium]